MALEVGRLVARIDIEGSFEQKLTAAKTAMEDAAKSAGRFDDAMSKAGQSGAKLKVSDEPKRKIDDAAKSATKLDDGLSKASEAGKRLDVSNDARRKLDDTATSAGKTATSLDKASESGKNMKVSDQPRQKLAETASVADQVNTKFSGLGLTMKQVVGMAGGAAGLGAVLTKGWDRISSIDTAQGKLRGLGHEAEGVSTIMDSALESVTGTAYGLGDAATIAANAVAAGIQPGKDLTKYLSMTADASAIAGVSLGEMGRILNQVQTGQSAYAGDLSQLADRGIPIYQWLGDEAGVAASEIKKMASTGQISSEMLFSAIQNNIGGAAQEMGGTLVGSLANVGAAFGRLGAAAIDPFKDDIMAAAAGAQEFAGTLAGVVGPAASVAASALGGIADVVGLIPTPILAATAGLVALQKTGLGASMAGAASTAAGALRGVGETMVLGGMYARDNIKANGLFAASMDGVRGAAGSLRTGLGNVVNMLGGPWMIGIAAAAMAVTDFIASSKSAAEYQDRLKEASTASAAAQTELADALMRSNGEMDAQASSAAQGIIQAELDKTNAAAELNVNFLNDIAAAAYRGRNSYADWAEMLDTSSSAANRNAAAHEMGKLELQAMGDAASETGFKMEDFAEIAAEGGPKWERLRTALMLTGDAGEAMVGKLESGKATIDGIVDSATEAEIASMALSEAFAVMADESATAEDKTNALKAALDALAGETLTADEATGKYYSTMEKLDGQIGKLSEGTGAFTRTLEDESLAFDMTSAKGQNLHATLKDMRDATLGAAGAGLDMGPIWEKNHATMEKLAQETGLSTDELWALADAALSFSEQDIQATVSVRNGGEVLGQLGNIAHELEGIEKGATVEVKNVGDDALNYLQSVGWQIERIPGTTDVRVTASTDEARAGLEEAIRAAGRLESLDPDVTVDTNAEWVTHVLGITADATEGLPDGHVEITDTTDTNLQRLANLGIEVSRDKHGRVLINDDDVDRARGRVQGLNGMHTSSTHTVSIGAVVGASVGAALGSRADGGIDGIRSFANGGTTLPSQAMIERPKGQAGLIQWAEAETGGEAFIPLAPSKRQRSRKIWAATGELLGINVGDMAKFADGGMLPPGDGRQGDMGGILVPLFGKFADGGITASGLVNFAKGVEGAPYVWGGVNWGDCSGAVSALANYVSGRSPFGSRFATASEGAALAERGFKTGRGSKGDLQIGWVNGGPYGGHTSATLPNGVNFEMGGARGNGQYGGSAAGANSGQYTNHAHWPAEMFADAGETLGGAAVDNRTQRQKNIDAIVQEGQRRNLSDRDIQIALMTAEQESGIRVLNNPADPASMNMAAEGTGYDGTSTGIFQQQNNGAWGTLADRMDPTKSAGMFYDQLEKIDGRDSMALTAVAQAVQGSGHPDAYAKWEGKAGEELAASKARLESLSKSGGGSGEGQKVFVTNWPSGGGSYARSSASSDAIADAKDAVEDAQKAAFIQDQSIAAMLARSAGRADLIQVEKFADGGFHGLENHSAHIAPAGSWRLFGEPETGGEAYIPLASHKRARSTQILAETARRMGYSIGAGVNLVGSVLTGNGLDTGWGGPSLSDLGIDTGALRDSLSPGVTAEAERAGQQIAAILQQLGAAVDQQVEGTLNQVNDGKAQLRQQYSRAMI